MKLALACPTIGQTRRGYERFMGDLFRVLGATEDVHLFKGAGTAGPNETVVPHLARTGVLARVFGRRLAYRRYQAEHASFAAMLLPHLRRERFDIVHVIDPPLMAHLARMRPLFPSGLRLLFTHAGVTSVDGLEAADHVHCLTAAARDDVLARGLPASRVSLIPVGIDADRLASRRGRAELREHWQLPPERFVVLCVAAVNRHHKRIDHLIDEVARVDGDLLLWLDGGLHPDGDPTLLDEARRRLGPRFKHSHVDSAQIGELYGVADVLVSAATDESFGMSIVEAMSVGRPAVVHDAPHFRDLLGGAAHHVDMQQAGALAAVLQALRDGMPPLPPLRDPRAAVAHLSWPALRSAYLDLYRCAGAETLCTA